MSSLSTGVFRQIPSRRRHIAPLTAGHDHPDVPGRYRPTPLGRAVQSAFLAIAGPLMLWQQRLTDRTALQRMSEHMLRDIGIDRAQADAEADKPFWRA